MHIDVIGDGPDLVLIHGWSMHSGVWQGLLQLLSTKYRCHLVDLPGHGKTVWRENDFDLSQLLPSLSAQLPEKAVYLGWSLGGMIALAMANRYPNKVSKLIMLASTPSFVQQEGWPCAVFSNSLLINYLTINNTPYNAFYAYKQKAQLSLARSLNS